MNKKFLFSFFILLFFSLLPFEYFDFRHKFTIVENKMTFSIEFHSLKFTYQPPRT